MSDWLIGLESGVVCGLFPVVKGAIPVVWLCQSPSIPGRVVKLHRPRGVQEEPAAFQVVRVRLEKLNRREKKG